MTLVSEPKKDSTKNYRAISHVEIGIKHLIKNNNELT